MNYPLSILFLFSLLSVIIQSQVIDPTQGATLKLVVETFRHGARQRIYNTEYPVKDTSNFGELTAAGQRMHYVLGQTLRQKYENSDIQFPNTYDHTFIYARSTDKNRTIMSAQSHLAGMFPLGFGDNVQQIDTQFLLPPFPTVTVTGLDTYSLPQGEQPTSIHVQLLETDQLLMGADMACQNSDSWSNANIGDPDWNTVQAFFQPIVDQLTAIPELGIPAGSGIYEISDLTDTLISTKWLGNAQQIQQISSLIEGFMFTEQQMLDPQNKNNLWVQMNLLYAVVLHLSMFKTYQQKHVLVTPYLNELLAFFNNALANQDTYFKWISLSAHDTTIALVSQAMNITSWECMEQYILGTLPANTPCIYTYPGFASSIIFELYEDASNEPFIKLLYNGTNQILCGTQNTYCYLDTFQHFVNNFIVADFDAECGNPVLIQLSDIPTYPSLPWWAITTIALLGIALVFSLYFNFVQRRKVSPQMIDQTALSDYQA